VALKEDCSELQHKLNRVAGQVSARFSMMEWSNQSHELAWTSGDFHSMAKLRSCAMLDTD